jgi:hypothetical protein
MWRRDISRCGVTFPEASGPHEVLMVITRGQIPVGDGLAGTRRVDKAPTARVDPNVIHVPTVDTEEDEIARGERIERNRTRRLLLRVGRAWNLNAHALVYVYG